MGIKSLLLELRRAWEGEPRIPSGTSIGKDVFIGERVLLDWEFGHLITIEDRATIVAGARVLCHDAASNRRLGVTWCAPVLVGKRAFIGADALIMPGVTIGDDAVVAAGAVVTKDVAPGAVVAGIPAAVISDFTEMDARRSALLKTRKTFGPDFAGGHLSRRRVAVLRTAALEGGYFIRVGPQPSGLGNVRETTVDPQARS